MKAYGYKEFGKPAIFEELDLDEPLIEKDNQVIVETLAVGMNNFDLIQSTGAFGGKLPIVPGKDVVGKVIGIGNDVKNIKIGDVVVASANHTYAAKVRMIEAKLTKKPDDISNEVAVTLVTPGITAYNAVNVFTSIKPHDKVLINGATGGVGAIAAQLAKKLGAYVIGVGSSKNAEYLKSLNLDEVAYYDTENINEKYKDKVDVAINLALNGADSALIGSVVKNGGQAASVGDSGDLKGKNIIFKEIMPLKASYTKTALTNLVQMVANNDLQVKVFKVLPLNLSGVIEGMKILSTHHAPGRIVMAKNK